MASIHRPARTLEQLKIDCGKKQFKQFEGVQVPCGEEAFRVADVDEVGASSQNRKNVNDSPSDFPVRSGHNRIDIPRSSRARPFEQFDDSGTDVAVTLGNACHLRHGDPLFTALSRLPGRRMKLD
jgi:hypothetical protein